MKLLLRNMMMVGALVSTLGFTANAAAPFRTYCPANLKALKEKPLEKRIEELPKSGEATYKKYKKLLKEDPTWESLLREEELVDIAEDLDVPIYNERLAKVLDEVAEDKDPGVSTALKIELSIKKLLQSENFRPAEITARIAQLKAGVENSWYRALGDRTLKETQYMYLGENLGKIDPESLIGKYVRETGAEYRWIKFPLTPKGKKLGKPKLVVAVSEASLKQFLKVAKTPNYMSVLGHANVMTAGDVIGFGGGANARSAIRLPGINTPLPFLIMKTSESVRLQRYMSLAADEAFNGWNHSLKLPWNLEGYCAEGGYSCCTHWLGNIPIGDELVDTYKFPGRFENKEKPKIQALQAYKAETAAEKKLEQVWKVPGNMQLSSTIGLEKENLSGEFASPGWVIQSLIGKADPTRVPVIFWITKDHRVKIPARPVFQFENPW